MQTVMMIESKEPLSEETLAKIRAAVDGTVTPAEGYSVRGLESEWRKTAQTVIVIESQGPLEQATLAKISKLADGTASPATVAILPAGSRVNFPAEDRKFSVARQYITSAEDHLKGLMSALHAVFIEQCPGSDFYREQAWWRSQYRRLTEIALDWSDPC